MIMEESILLKLWDMTPLISQLNRSMRLLSIFFHRLYILSAPVLSSRNLI
uniref:Uncharacterized protein n=1 Tax=Schistosoma japonicum TaxID=6182 RepID=Q5BVT8_SCHJA|nr:unknown [Schistosoma japonicum]